MLALNESFPMNTNMMGFRWFPKIFASFVLRTKVASALEGLNQWLPMDLLTVLAEIYTCIKRPPK